MSGEDEKHLLGEGKRLAERAVQFDKDGQRTAAIFYYTGRLRMKTIVFEIYIWPVQRC